MWLSVLNTLFSLINFIVLLNHKKRKDTRHYNFRINGS